MTEWRLQANCFGASSGFMYPEGQGRIFNEQLRAALALCRECPVQRQCLQHALEHEELYGIWGGTTEKERNRMRTSQTVTTRKIMYGARSA